MSQQLIDIFKDKESKLVIEYLTGIFIVTGDDVKTTDNTTRRLDFENAIEHYQDQEGWHGLLVCIVEIEERTVVGLRWKHNKRFSVNQVLKVRGLKLRYNW